MVVVLDLDPSLLSTLLSYVASLKPIFNQNVNPLMLEYGVCIYYIHDGRNVPDHSRYLSTTELVTLLVDLRLCIHDV